MLAAPCAIEAHQQALMCEMELVSRSIIQDEESFLRDEWSDTAWPVVNRMQSVLVAFRTQWLLCAEIGEKGDGQTSCTWCDAAVVPETGMTIGGPLEGATNQRRPIVDVSIHALVERETTLRSEAEACCVDERLRMVDAFASCIVPHFEWSHGVSESKPLRSLEGAMRLLGIDMTSSPHGASVVDGSITRRCVHRSTLAAQQTGPRGAPSCARAPQWSSPSPLMGSVRDTISRMFAGGTPSSQGDRDDDGNVAAIGSQRRASVASRLSLDPPPWW